MTENATEKPRGLRAQIHEDWIHHGSDWTKPGFRAIVMYRFGVWRLGIRNPIFRKPLSILYRMMHRFVRNRYGIELHDTCTVGRRTVFAHQGAIVIHEHAVIGDDCLIRQGVTLGAAGHYSQDAAPKLCNGVKVGAGAMILGKVTIGDGAMIGPNAVVTMNVPPNGRAFAPPARIIVPKDEEKKEE